LSIIKNFKPLCLYKIKECAQSFQKLSADNKLLTISKSIIITNKQFCSQNYNKTNQLRMVPDGDV